METGGRGGDGMTPEQVLQIPESTLCRGRLFHETPAESRNDCRGGSESPQHFLRV